MLPRWHIIYGIVFTVIIWIFAPHLSIFYLSLIFLSSVLIDLDHYICSVMKTGRLGLFHSFDYHRKMGAIQKNERTKGIRKKGDFHLFHTVEFHALVALIGVFFTPAFFIFIGMTFHSLLDLIQLTRDDYVYRREYFFFKWLGDRF